MTERRQFALWRAWEPLYDFPAVFSVIDKEPIGGTCSQLLWHARHLVEAGHRVQVLGVSPHDILEEGVEFVGAKDRAAQEAAVRSGKVREPFAVLLEGGFAGAPFFREQFPGAAIVQIGQNIDRWGRRRVFDLDRFIDVYALVSPGQLALYSVREPRLRHKLVMVRNAVPWRRLHSKIQAVGEEDRLAWVGAWTKKGLREWGLAMQRILGEYPQWRWELFGPKYGRTAADIPTDVFAGVNLPRDRVSTSSLPMPRLLSALAAAKIVGVSLGNESGPSSALDAHAMGKPVVSGNDVIYSYVNPTSTGLRASDAGEIYSAVKTLVESAPLRARLGAAGRDFVRRQFSEVSQQADLENLIDHIEATRAVGAPASCRGTSERQEAWGDIAAILRRKASRVMALSRWGALS